MSTKTRKQKTQKQPVNGKAAQAAAEAEANAAQKVAEATQAKAPEAEAPQSEVSSPAATGGLTWETWKDGFEYATGTKGQWSAGVSPNFGKRVVLGSKGPGDARFRTHKEYVFNSVEEAKAKAAELDGAPASPAPEVQVQQPEQ
jgi:hypothetical protein